MSRKIRTIFSDIEGTYERINHLLTFGFDILWRRRAVRLAVREGGGRWLDVCTGTGETAVYLQQRSGGSTRVTAVDFSPAMIGAAVAKPGAEGIDFVLADTGRLPFPDDSFDLVTLSFATRNLNTGSEALPAVFAEIARVVRPDGRYINLETSQPRNALLRTFFHGYVALVVRRLGRWISGSDAAYAYLGSTIPRFHPPEDLAAILTGAGFAQVEIRRLLGGVAAIHIARKAPAGEGPHQ